jgi:hypothetical protein
MGKIYPEEIKNKAGQLYRLDEETTYADVGRDLGTSPASGFVRPTVTRAGSTTVVPPRPTRKSWRGCGGRTWVFPSVVGDPVGDAW